jgi:hypothetical protein
MGRLMVFVALAGALLGLTSPSPASAAPEPTVTVVTQNLYIGADLMRILAVRDLEDVPAAAGEVFAAASAAGSRSSSTGAAAMNQSRQRARPRSGRRGGRCSGRRGRC